MKSVLRQLQAWRFRERMIRLAWGGARWLAIVATVFALACAIDYTIDRQSLTETPIWLRIAMSIGQLALAAGLVYVFMLRPWAKTPPLDDLATQAEKAFPAFDHRLVTALQLNRASADTRGMSKMLIGEVTREAGEIASNHNLLGLIDYRRLLWAMGVLAPVLVCWGIFFAIKPALAGILIQRQLMPWQEIEIPRRYQLKNITQPVWPNGAEAVVRFEVTVDGDDDATGGTLYYQPDGLPQSTTEMTREMKPDGTPTNVFSVKLPPGSLDFDFHARIGDGRTKEAGRVRFEPPPQLGRDDPANPPLTAVQVLPDYLGRDPDGVEYLRKNDGWTRGEVIDALPQSKVIVNARFNKPVKVARLFLIEQGEGIREREIPTPVLPFYTAMGDKETTKDADRLFTTASFGFNTTPEMIAYRIALEDDRHFTNKNAEIRRNVRMWEDRPPTVEFKPESTRNPDPDDFFGKGNPKDYEWEMALGPDGIVQVIYNAHSPVGVRQANIRYRVIPKGVQFDLYPEEYKRIQHPRDDANLIVYDRLPLTRFVLPKADPTKPDAKAPDLGPFDTELGLFRYSLRGVPRFDRNKVNVQFYPLPARDPTADPGEVEAGGRYNFEVSGLLKKFPDGTRSKLELGDTVEVYVEVFDKVTKPGPDGKPIIDTSRPAGYTREAKRKIVMTEAEVAAAHRARDEARQKLQDKLRELANDQTDVFRPKK